MFLRPFESAEIVKGSKIVLEGAISGSAPFEITCSLNDKQIRNDKRHLISVENDTVTLQISNFESGDDGVYQCTVANDVGETSCSCQISLKGWSSLRMFGYNVQMFMLVNMAFKTKWLHITVICCG